MMYVGAQSEKSVQFDFCSTVTEVCENRRLWGDRDRPRAETQLDCLLWFQATTVEFPSLLGKPQVLELSAQL